MKGQDELLWPGGNDKMAKKIYAAIGDMCMLSNLRYPHEVQTSGIWLISEVTKAKNTFEIRMILDNKKDAIVVGGFRRKLRE